MICYIAKQNRSKFWKTREILATTSSHLWSRATAINISRVIVKCFPFDVIVFAMLPAHGIWRERVSLLDAMWPWTSQWMGALWRVKRQLYNTGSVWDRKCISISAQLGGVRRGIWRKQIILRWSGRWVSPEERWFAARWELGKVCFRIYTTLNISRMSTDFITYHYLNLYCVIVVYSQTMK